MNGIKFKPIRISTWRMKTLNIVKIHFFALYTRDGSVGPVSRYREHFTEIP